MRMFLLSAARRNVLYFTLGSHNRRNKKFFPLCHLTKSSSLRQNRRWKKYFDYFLLFKMTRSSICPVFQIFEMNMKSSVYREYRNTNERFDSTHETTWKALNKHKKIAIDVECVRMLLWKKKTEDSVFDSNDAKVWPLQIVARADCARVKLINDVLWRFRPNWITRVCAVLTNLLVRNAT